MQTRKKKEQELHIYYSAYSRSNFILEYIVTG